MTMVSLDTVSHSVVPFHPPPVTNSTIVYSGPVQQPYRPIFSILPEELIVKILEGCDFKGLLACQLTCRALRDVIVGSAILRYKLALSQHGMCDGMSSDLSTAEKLDLLTAHADAWQNLDMASPEKADILVGCSPPIAISCNVLVFFKDNEWPGHHPPPVPGVDLLVLRVPSALRRIEAAHWVLPLPADVGQVCIDASQDLLIYLSGGRFHACTLSTGGVHPHTEHDGSFDLWNGSRGFGYVFNLCVCGDFVAGDTHIYVISVWNWKTGQFVSNQKNTGVQFSSFDFVDEHHILYANSNEDSIYVYDLRHDQQQWRQQPHKEKEKEMRLVRFQLALPPINRATTSRYIQIRRNALTRATGTPPLPNRSNSPGHGESAPATPPFHTDPHERLMVVRIATSPVEWGEEQFELHIPARTFLDHFSASTIATGRNGQRGGGECEVEEDNEVVVVPWTAWRNAVRATPTRRLPYVVHARFIVFGMRAVSSPPDWIKDVFHVDSYLLRARRRQGSEVGAEAEAGPGGPAGARMYETRQAVRLPREAEDKTDYLCVLCEDALLCYEVDQISSMISHAYWYTV